MSGKKTQKSKVEEEPQQMSLAKREDLDSSSSALRPTSSRRRDKRADSTGAPVVGSKRKRDDEEMQPTVAGTHSLDELFDSAELLELPPSKRMALVPQTPLPPNTDPLQGTTAVAAATEAQTISNTPRGQQSSRSTTFLLNIVEPTVMDEILTHRQNKHATPSKPVSQPSVISQTPPILTPSYSVEWGKSHGGIISPVDMEFLTLDPYRRMSGRMPLDPPPDSPPPPEPDMDTDNSFNAVPPSPERVDIPSKRQVIICEGPASEPIAAPRMSISSSFFPKNPASSVRDIEQGYPTEEPSPGQLEELRLAKEEKRRLKKLKKEPLVASRAERPKKKAVDFGEATSIPSPLRKLRRIIQKILVQPNGIVFAEPVDPDKLGIKDYFDIIKKPMDLGTITTQIDRGAYGSSLDKAVEDVRLTFNNAIKYNNHPKHPIHILAKQMLDMFEQKLAKMPTSSSPKRPSSPVESSGHPQKKKEKKDEEEYVPPEEEDEDLDEEEEEEEAEDEEGEEAESSDDEKDKHKKHKHKKHHHKHKRRSSSSSGESEQLTQLQQQMEEMRKKLEHLEKEKKRIAEAAAKGIAVQPAPEEEEPKKAKPKPKPKRRAPSSASGGASKSGSSTDMTFELKKRLIAEIKKRGRLKEAVGKIQERVPGLNSKYLGGGCEIDIDMDALDNDTLKALQPYADEAAPHPGAPRPGPITAGGGRPCLSGSLNRSWRMPDSATKAADEARRKKFADAAKAKEEAKKGKAATTTSRKSAIGQPKPPHPAISTSSASADIISPGVTAATPPTTGSSTVSAPPQHGAGTDSGESGDSSSSSSEMSSSESDDEDRKKMWESAASAAAVAPAAGIVATESVAAPYTTAAAVRRTSTTGSVVVPSAPTTVTSSAVPQPSFGLSVMPPPASSSTPQPPPVPSKAASTFTPAAVNNSSGASSSAPATAAAAVLGPSAPAVQIFTADKAKETKPLSLSAAWADIGGSSDESEEDEEGTADAKESSASSGPTSASKDDDWARFVSSEQTRQQRDQERAAAEERRRAEEQRQRELLAQQEREKKERAEKEKQAEEERIQAMREAERRQREEMELSATAGTTVLESENQRAAMEGFFAGAGTASSSMWGGIDASSLISALGAPPSAATAALLGDTKAASYAPDYSTNTGIGQGLQQKGFDQEEESSSSSGSSSSSSSEEEGQL